jgi:hypothetical protein
VCYMIESNRDRVAIDRNGMRPATQERKLMDCQRHDDDGLSCDGTASFGIQSSRVSVTVAAVNRVAFIGSPDKYLPNADFWSCIHELLACLMKKCPKKCYATQLSSSVLSNTGMRNLNNLDFLTPWYT